MSATGNNPAEVQKLLEQAQRGDQTAWGTLLDRHRDWLRRMVDLRMDRKLQGRIDASDVIQEAYIEANERLPEYLQNRDMPFRLWLRFLVAQKLLVLHRHHIGTRKRSAGREERWPESSSAHLADVLLAQGKSPSEVAAQDELRSYLCEALDQMDPLDREVLTLRHFEQLSNVEVAQVLEIEPSAASKRYVRALDRLHQILAPRPDVFGSR